MSRDDDARLMRDKSLRSPILAAVAKVTQVYIFTKLLFFTKARVSLSPAFFKKARFDVDRRFLLALRLPRGSTLHTFFILYKYLFINSVRTNCR